MLVKTSKGSIFQVVVNGQVLVSRKYSTRAMVVQKGIDEIVKYGSKAEILDFSRQ
jgi:ABC-type arginine transport system ATPase subunit